MQTELEKLVSLYRELGIDRQIDYDKSRKKDTKSDKKL